VSGDRLGRIEVAPLMREGEKVSAESDVADMSTYLISWSPMRIRSTQMHGILSHNH
jgi:hypothetical protein